MIRVFVQGEQDQELFGLIGQWVVDKDVHKEAGMPVTGMPGDLWLVCDDATACFCQLRLQKNSKGHIRFMLARTVRNRTALIRRAEAEAGKRGAHEVYANDRRSAAIWAKLGYAMQETGRQGEFRRWQKKL